MHTINTTALATFHQKLHAWYAAHGRHDLPWRKTCDAYAIYISEIMLQQTQVQTVLARFYHPFLRAFPSLQALADAPQEAVMKQWEGLGYYSRAANLHKAAQQVAPHLPATVDELQALPGIGRNTAHAVAAFAHHVPVPVMEANVKRVLCRIFALENPKTEALWQAATALLDSAEPFDYNQAMMDIGAMVCTKRQPDCVACPANHMCKGQQNPTAYPAPKTKKATPIRKVNIVVWSNRAGEFYMTPRETAFLGGLYGFDEYPETAMTVSFENIAYPLDAEKFMGEVSQTYSHFRCDAQVWCVDVGEASGNNWYSLADIQSLALSKIDHKIVQLLRNRIMPRGAHNAQ
jgi:A/G-specific adenine glycosylase